MTYYSDNEGIVRIMTQHDEYRAQIRRLKVLNSVLAGVLLLGFGAWIFGFPAPRFFRSNQSSVFR